MNINSVTNFISSLFDKAREPASALPSLLIKCTAIQRPGLSPEEITSKVIERNKILGIPTGENPDGSANIVNEYTHNIVLSVVEALKNDAVVQVAIPANSLVIQATGGNAGGPVTCVGTNLTDTTGYGIIQ